MDTMLNNNGPVFKNVTYKQGLIKYDNETKQKSHLAHARVHAHTHTRTYTQLATGRRDCPGLKGK